MTSVKQRNVLESHNNSKIVHSPLPFLPWCKGPPSFLVLEAMLSCMLAMSLSPSPSIFLLWYVLQTVCGQKYWVLLSDL